MRIPFIGGQNRGRTANVDTQQLINWYVETDNKDTRTPRYIVPTHGLTSNYTIPTESNPLTGIHFYNSVLLCPVGSTLYSVTVSNSPSSTSLGTLSGFSPAGLTQMIDNGLNNGHQVWICDGSNAWVYDSNVPSVTKMGSGQGYPASGVSMITTQDTYGIFAQAGTNVFWLTDLENFANVTATNFATPESITDTIVSIISDQSRLYIMGQKNMEVWYNSGDPNFPFTRIEGATYAVGSAAARSAVLIDNSIVWIGTNQWGGVSIYQMRGENPPQRISTTQIDYILSSPNSPSLGFDSNAWAFTYKYNGHEFYVLHTNSGSTPQLTLVWDATTGEWHSRSSDASVDTLQRWAATCHEYVPTSNLTYFGYISGPTLMRADNSGGGELGVLPTRTLVSPHVNNMDERIFINSVQVIGNFSPSDYIPPSGTLTLSYSKDNGQTFPSSQTYTIGSSNVQRMIFRRLGMARDWVFKLTTTSNPIIMDAFIHTRNKGNEGNNPDPSGNI